MDGDDKKAAIFLLAAIFHAAKVARSPLLQVNENFEPQVKESFQLAESFVAEAAKLGYMPPE